MDPNRYFFEGESAYWRDGEFTPNPYPSGSHEAKEWAEGFNCAFENDTYYSEDD